MEEKSKSVWRIIKNESGKRNTAEQLPLTLKSNNINIRLDYEVEAFSSYFLNLIDSLKTENMDVDSAMLCLRNSFPKGFPVISNIKRYRMGESKHNTLLRCKMSQGRRHVSALYYKAIIRSDMVKTKEENYNVIYCLYT